MPVQAVHSSSRNMAEAVTVAVGLLGHEIKSVMQQTVVFIQRMSLSSGVHLRYKLVG